MVDVRSSRYHFVPGASGPTIVGGDGCWLITDDGRRILDAAGGAMVANIGHGRSVVADAVRDALDGGAYVVPIWSTPHRERLHDVLATRWLPAGMGNVFFTSGGSESADSALRLARAHHVAAGRPERWKVVGRHPSYHGITLAAMAVGATAAGAAGYEPLLLDFPKVPWDDADAVVGDDRARGSLDHRRLPVRADHRCRRCVPDAVRRVLAAPSTTCAGATTSCSSPTR